MLERALVECCELPPSEPQDDGDSSTGTTEDEAPGGSLAKGFEVKFTGLVAKHCHSFGSRVLALAILERSLEQDQKDALKDADNLSVSAGDEDVDDENENSSNNSTPLSSKDDNDEEGGDSELGGSESEDEQESDEDDEYDPNEKSISRGKGKRNQQQRKRGRGRPPKRAKVVSTDDASTLKPKSTRVLRKRLTASANQNESRPIS